MAINAHTADENAPQVPQNVVRAGFSELPYELPPRPFSAIQQDGTGFWNPDKNRGDWTTVELGV